MKFFITTFAFLFVLGLGVTAWAQEPEIVSGIVARVNNDIITKVDYDNAVRDFREQLANELRRQGKGDAEIDAEFAKLKPTILDVMIEDLLLEQKAKELNIDVEAEVNQRMLEIAHENGQKTLTDFEAELKKQGMDPEVARSSLRKQLQQQYVLQREVLRPVFDSLTDKDKLDFYNKNKDYFKTPAVATISEIFLALDNQTANEVEQRARRIIAELRAGKSFTEAVQQYSAPTRPSRALNGKIGSVKLVKGELKDDLLAALKDLKAGDVTEPIRQTDGFLIIHVDEKKEATVRPFNDPEVQRAVNNGATMERSEEARKKYMKKLRAEAFVDINKDFVATTEKTEKSEK